MAKAKRIKGIKCNAAASDGIKLVLHTRFVELCSFRETALDWSDPEGVHSMRVASRRLRSALRDFNPYLRKRGLTAVLKQLRKMAATLGEVRDQDVALMALEEMQVRIPAEFAPALQQFVDKRKEVRDRARKKLTQILTGDDLRQLESSFSSALDKAVAVANAPQDSSSQVSYLSMSRSVILGRLKELEKLGDNLFRPFEVEHLHDMRIAAKRLRYAIELFQQCWGRSIASYAKRVARMQTALGEVHDCDVWIQSFGDEIARLKKQKDNEHLSAFVWLLSHFVKLRTKHLRQALRLWGDWETQETSIKLRTLLQSERKRARRRQSNVSTNSDNRQERTDANTESGSGMAG